MHSLMSSIGADYVRHNTRDGLVLPIFSLRFPMPEILRYYIMDRTDSPIALMEATLEERSAGHLGDDIRRTNNVW